MKLLDLRNKRFGYLKAIKRHKKSLHGRVAWVCKCVCGKSKIATRNDLCGGMVKSCGCKTHLRGNENCSWTGCGEITGEKFSFIRFAAKRRNIKFDITIRQLWNLYLKQNRKCALSGREIHFGDRRKEGTASLDRIDSNKGYRRDNIQWVHKDVNFMKKDFEEEYFIETCKQIANFKKG